MAPHQLAVAMQKGGVGKSTTAMNLAGALADGTDRTTTDGHDVLVVDADPQGFVTIQHDLVDYYTDDAATSLYDALTDIDQLQATPDLVRSTAEFDLLPAHGRNFQLERELWSLSRTQERLGMALDELPDDAYDYVIIDAPPNLGPLADGALLSAENVLFASKADKIAPFSMRLLLNEIETLEKEFGTDIASVGAVLNMVERNSITDERIRWFEQNIGAANLTRVPDSVAVEGAHDQHGSLFSPDYEPVNGHRASKAAEIRDRYDALAQQVVDHYV
jgi:chromosome partitioning protein